MPPATINAAGNERSGMTASTPSIEAIREAMPDGETGPLRGIAAHGLAVVTRTRGPR